MEKKKELGRRQTTKCGAKRQARACPVTTPQQFRASLLNVELNTDEDIEISSFNSR